MLPGIALASVLKSIGSAKKWNAHGGPSAGNWFRRGIDGFCHFHILRLHSGAVYSI